MAKVKKAKKSAGKKTKPAGTRKKAKKKQPKKKQPKKKQPKKKQPKKKTKAKPGGVHAAPPLTLGVDDGEVVLFDAVCDTVNCPTPELARAVTALLARQATNAHAMTNPTHAPRVVPEA